MKLSAPLCLLIAGFMISGCAFHKSKSSKAAASSSATPSLIVTPDTSLAARVISYNADGRFVVLSFPIGRMPKADQIFFLYRGGLKSGEVRITGPQRDNNIVADLIAGDARAGDEVRDH